MEQACPQEHEVAGVLALVTGLRTELAAPGAALTHDVAQAILTGYVRDLGRTGA